MKESASRYDANVGFRETLSAEQIRADPTKMCHVTRDQRAAGTAHTRTRSGNRTERRPCRPTSSRPDHRQNGVARAACSREEHAPERPDDYDCLCGQPTRPEPIFSRPQQCSGGPRRHAMPDEAYLPCGEPRAPQQSDNESDGGAVNGRANSDQSQSWPNTSAPISICRLCAIAAQLSGPAARSSDIHHGRSARATPVTTRRAWRHPVA
jgi:hypothetical protein